MTLEPVPSTTNVPLVMQIGKWRRQITIPTLQTCKDNPLTDKNQTRLPRTSAEGHIPRIAVTTGGADALECLAPPHRHRRLRVHAPTAGAGRVHLYAGGGGTNSFIGGRQLRARDDALVERDQARELRHRHPVVRGEHQQVRRHEAAGQRRQRRPTTPTRAAACSSSHLHFYWLQNERDVQRRRPPYIGNLTATRSDGVDPDRQPDVPQGHGARAVAGRAGRRRPARRSGRSPSAAPSTRSTAVNPPTSEWIYLPSNPSDSQKRARAST